MNINIDIFLGKKNIFYTSDINEIPVCLVQLVEICHILCRGRCSNLGHPISPLLKMCEVYPLCYLTKNNSNKYSI